MSPFYGSHVGWYDQHEMSLVRSSRPRSFLIIAILAALQVAHAAQPVAPSSAPASPTAQSLIAELRPLFLRAKLNFDDAALKGTTLTITNMRIVETVAGAPKVTFSAQQAVLRLKQPRRADRPPQFDEVMLDRPILDSSAPRATTPPATAPADGAVFGAILAWVESFPLRTLQIKQGRVIREDGADYLIDLDLRRADSGDYQFRLIHRGDKAGQMVGTVKFEDGHLIYAVQGDWSVFPERLPPVTQPEP